MARRDFEIISEFTDYERIARGPGVHIRQWLNETFGYGAWRKLKGKAWVRYHNGRIAFAEIHWFEAHGIGRVDEKVVREIKRRS